MGTAVAKRSVWTMIAENPFAFFDAESFRSAVIDRLEAYSTQVGGVIEQSPSRDDTGDIFRVRLREIQFPDGPGHASVEIAAYRAYGRLSVSVIVDHDRLFRSLDGRSTSRLYLHDYKFVRSYGADAPPRVEELDEALSGVERARHAVALRNAEPRGYSSLGRIRIAIRREHSAAAEAVAETETEDQPPVGHRRVELLEAMAKERKRPIQIRLRQQRRPEERDQG